MATDTLIRLYEDTKKPGQCSAAGCRAALDWYRTLNDKGMPMNRGAVPVKSENDPATRRVIAFFSSADSHWATCPARAKFGKGGGAAASSPDRPPMRAYFSATYDRETARWHWVILANSTSTSVEIARSVPSYPTEHDANAAAKTVKQQLLNAEARR